MKTRKINITSNLRIYIHGRTNFIFLRYKTGGYLQLGWITISWSKPFDKKKRRANMNS